MNHNASARFASDSFLKSTEVFPFVRAGRLIRRASIVTVAIVSTGLSAVSHATILEFDQIRESGTVIPTISGRAVEQDYGDRVDTSPMNVSGGQFTYGNDGEGFTPNVVVDYIAGSGTPINPGVSLWTSQYGDLTNVLFGNNNSLSLNVEFSADTGFDVELYSFDLAGFPIRITRLTPCGC
jgi:hypothetical protein